MNNHHKFSKPLLILNFLSEIHIRQTELGSLLQDLWYAQTFKPFHKDILLYPYTVAPGGAWSESVVCLFT